MSVTLLRLDTGQPFVEQAERVQNDDGSVSYRTPAGNYAGQEPNAYGVRNNNTSVGAYQKATERGNLTTFVPRPGDLPCTYLVGEGRAYS